jgi:hypothetical protein
MFEQNKNEILPKRRSIALPGEPLTKEEMIYEIELAINSPIKYTAEEAKKILKL